MKTGRAAYPWCACHYLIYLLSTPTITTQLTDGCNRLGLPNELVAVCSLDAKKQRQQREQRHRPHKAHQSLRFTICDQDWLNDSLRAPLSDRCLHDDSSKAYSAYAARSGSGRQAIQCRPSPGVEGRLKRCGSQPRRCGAHPQPGARMWRTHRNQALQAGEAV